MRTFYLPAPPTRLRRLAQTSLLLALLALLVGAGRAAHAQAPTGGVGIGTTAPDASAALDIVSSGKGVLLPRVADAATIASPALGLIVYQTGSPAGFHYYDGAAWQQLVTGSAGSFIRNGSAVQAGSSFSVDGAGTVGGLLTAGSATVGGRLGVGTAAPVTQLANSGDNVVGADGYGLGPYALGWSSAEPGYVAGIYNGSSQAGANGLAVKVAGAGAVALDVSQGAAGGTPGTSLLRLGGDGALGLGTSTPGLQLDVAGSGAGTSLGLRGGNAFDHLYLSHDGYAAVLRAGGADQGLSLQVGNGTSGGYGGQTYTEGLRLLAGGNVGVGTSTPGQKLEVAGLVYSNTGGFMFPDGTIQTTAATGAGGSPGNPGSGSYVQNQTSPQAGASFNITGSGTVGATLTAQNAVVTAALTGSGADVGTVVGVGVRADGGLNLGQNTSGKNIYLGYQAGQANTTGGFNQFSGYQAGQANTTGSFNQFSGFQSGLYNTTGGFNQFSGYQAGQDNTTGNHDQFSGFQNGSHNTTGDYNQFSGFRSGFYNTTGSNNTALGHGSGFTNTTGKNNVFSGYQSGYYNTTGSNNTALGYQSGPAIGSGDLSNATALGANVSLTQSNTVILGNGASVGIGTSAPSQKLDVDGTARLRGLTTAGVVTTDASGNLGSAAAASLDPTTASNGLTKMGSTFALGGTLTAPTTLAQNGSSLTIAATTSAGTVGQVTGQEASFSSAISMGYGQSFTLPGGVTITRVDVYGGGDGGGTGTLTLYQGAPGGTVLGSQSVTFVSGAMPTAIVLATPIKVSTAGVYSFSTGGFKSFAYYYNNPYVYGDIHLNAMPYSSNDLKFLVYYTATVTLYAGPNGQVGIGTDAPTAVLDVVGTARLRGLTVAGVVTTDASGNLGSAAASTLQDNLGNGVATTTVNLQGNALTGSGASISGVGVGVRADGGLNLGQNTTGNNLYLGYQAGQASTNGIGNLFVGYQAGYKNTTGGTNQFVGYQSGYNSTTGGSNLFSGYQSGYANTIGGGNVFSGYQSGYANITGSSNVFSGYQSGYSNALGGSNTFNGCQSGYANTIGGDNVFSGSRSGYANTTGSSNTFNGTASGYSNTSGSSNVFSGFWSGYSNTSGSSNVFSGFWSGGSNTSGKFNLFSGNQSGFYNTTGDNNLFSGHQSGFYNTTGSNNTALGANSGPADGSGNLTNATALGANVSLTQSNTVILGNGASVGIGTSAPSQKLDVDGTARLRGLTTAGVVTTDASGNLGSAAASTLQDNLGNHTATQALNLQANALTGTGADLGTVVGVGVRADGGLNLGQNTTRNIYLGYQAGQANTRGSANVFSGYQSGSANVEGSFNVFSGTESGRSNTRGNANVFSGYQSGLNNTTGINNTALGSNSGPAVGNLVNATALGANATVSASNTIQLGDANITSLRCQVALTTTSDARFKYDVQPDVPGLSFITALRPVTYRLDPARLAAFQRTGVLGERSAPDPAAARHTGFLAQDVAQAARALGFDFDGVQAPAGARDYYGLNYAQFVVPLVRAVQEQQAQLDALRAENATLKTRAATLEARAAQAEADHASLLTLQAQVARLLGQDAQAQK